VRQQAGIGVDVSAAGASYSLADVHLSGGVPADEVAVFFAPDGQLVCVPFADGSYKLVANVADAPPEPPVGFMQELVDTRGPRAERPVIKDIVWGSRFLRQPGAWRTRPAGGLHRRSATSCRAGGGDHQQAYLAGHHGPAGPRAPQQRPGPAEPHRQPPPGPAAVHAR
jgi:hypothetical protein